LVVRATVLFYQKKVPVTWRLHCFPLQALLTTKHTDWNPRMIQIVRQHTLSLMKHAALFDWIDNSFSPLGRSNEFSLTNAPC